MEQWKDVVGYEGLYSVSDLGRIKSHDRIVGGGKGYLLKGEIKKDRNNNGYRILKLTKNAIRATCKVHRIVAIAFIPNPDNKPEVNHKNGIRHDNRVENLEWATGSENNLHKFRDLKCKKPKWGSGRSGALNGKSKQVNQYDLNGELIKEWGSIRQIELSGLSAYSIKKNAIGNADSAHGFIWKYKN